ncbi:MAG: TonB-dependent receptor plug domain-containing protein [Bacteroidia bacterium]
MFKISCVLFFILQIAAGVAQNLFPDTAKQLQIVEVSSSRLAIFSSANKTEKLDSSILNRYSTNNLADVLTNESQVFIKSYGMGSLATTSLRGAAATQTAILWNGFNIQGPMNGLVDMALIPANFINEAKIQYGGAGALWGSGAVGGSIHLNNIGVFDRGISVSANTSFGSFSDRQQQVQVEISKKRFVSSVKLFNHDAKNDFPFINIAQSGKPHEKQSNAELKEYGLMQENYFQINARQKINTHFWYQFNDRNIPPSMTQNINVANQKDVLYRITSEWERTGDKMKLLARAAYFDEFLFYNDSLISLNSKSRTKVFITEAESRFSITKYDLVNIGVNNTYSEAITTDFIRNPHQNRTAVFASYKIHSLNDSWNAVLSARQEFMENKSIPFIPSLDIKGRILKYFYLKANAAKHYRIPTFNDLYWAQGGNPNLNAESGWSEEVSIENIVSKKIISWELAATVFNRNIDNWIIWLPNDYGIWSPENILKVWSRGVEYKVKFSLEKNKFKFLFSGLYNYVLSTNEKAATASDNSLGKQLIYVPIQNAQGTISVSYKGTSLSYTQIYTGYRYTLSDNTDYLNPYTIGNVNLSQTFSFASSKIKVFLQINNVWKETYQVLEYRAMPLLNYQVGLSLQFNQPNKKQ